MNKPLYDFFAQDHRRLEQLLEEATNKDVVDMVLYNEFRSGLLTHIKMEEK
ncbi:MAG: hemerythrin domain-containing protein, partial [Flavobacteriales bacterium]|nr:hemerythrin domain-containing protein [Flavobacteriales bacterium]